MVFERTHFILDRFRELMPDREDTWLEVSEYVIDICYSHSSLLHISVDPDDPTGTRESCYAIAEEAVKRYKFCHGLDK